MIWPYSAITHWREQADLWREQAERERAGKELWRKRYEDAVQGVVLPPAVLGTIDVSEVVELIWSIFPSISLAPYKARYKLTTLEAIQGFVRRTRMVQLEPVPGVRECADYVFGVLGELSYADIWGELPVGLIDGTYKGGHVWLIAVGYDTSISPRPRVTCIESTPPAAGDIIPLEALQGEIITRVVIP